MPTLPRLSFGTFFSTKYQQEDKCNEFPSIDITYTFLRVDSDSTGQYSLPIWVFFLASGYCRRMHKSTRVYCPKIPHTNRYCRTIRLCTSMNKCFCFFFWGFTNIFKRLYRAQNWHSFRERLIVVLYYYQQSSV